MRAGSASVNGHIRKESQTGPLYDITARFWLHRLDNQRFFFKHLCKSKRTFVGWIE